MQVVVIIFIFNGDFIPHVGSWWTYVLGSFCYWLSKKRFIWYTCMYWTSQQAFETTTLELLVVLQLLLVLQEHCCVFAWFVFDLLYHYPCLSWVSPSSQGLVQKLFYLLVKYLTPAFAVRFTAFTVRFIWNTVCLVGIYSLLHHVIMDGSEFSFWVVQLCRCCFSWTTLVCKASIIAFSSLISHFWLSCEQAGMGHHLQTVVYILCFWYSSTPNWMVHPMVASAFAEKGLVTCIVSSVHSIISFRQMSHNYFIYFSQLTVYVGRGTYPSRCSR